MVFSALLGGKFLKFLPYLLALLAVLAAVWFTYNKGHDHGVLETEQAYRLAIEKERHRQIEANQATLDKARERQVQLEQLLGKRDAALKRLTAESLQDPDADRPAIGVDSVRRINEINRSD